MKVRTDFVTNSSSSSFICEICGREEGGYGCGMSEYGFVECENGHVMCEDHISYEDVEKEEIIKSILMRKWNENTREDLKKMTVENLADYFDAIPEQACPICQLKALSIDDLIKYALKESGGGAELLKKIKDRFHGYSEFSKWLKS